MLKISSETKQLVSQLLRYYASHKKLIAIALIALCVFSLVDAGMIYFVKPLIDQGLTQANSQTLRTGAALVIVIFFIRGLASFISNYAIGYVSSQITYTIRQQAFNKLLALPMSFYDGHSKGSLISKLVYDTEQISQAISKAAMVIIRESLIIIVLLAMMIYNSWQLTSIFLLVGPIITLIIRKVAKRFKRISSKLQETMGHVTKASEQAMLNQQEILLLNTTKQISKQFETINNHNRQQTMKFVATAAQNNPVIQLIASFAIATILVLASFEHVLTSLTAGTFTLVLIAMGSLLKPLKQLSNVNQHLQKGLAAASSLFGLLAQNSEIDQGKKSLQGTKFTIGFEQLTFQYHGKDKPAIDNFTATITAGTTVALVGESGSGKTTISNLLLRLYQAPEESIFVNGIAIEKFTLTSLRSHFAFVSQNIVLIDDSLANNISFGCPRSFTRKDIEQAAIAANVIEFAQQMPQGLDSLIGENGRNLSGGQRQRIAIARAILRDAAIIVLDEATSALDNNSEKLVQQAFEQLAQQKTMIIIAHRLSTVASADCIFVMDKGQLVEQGSHQQLIVQAGVYNTLYQHEKAVSLNR